MITNNPNAPTTLSYPFPTLTKITGKPTAVMLKTLTKQVFTNARAIPCHQANGLYGHLGLIMGDTAYQALPNVTAAWADVAAPGNVPTIAGGADAVTITNTMETYRQSKRRFDLQQQVDSDLKAQLIAAVDPEYISSLEDNTLEFANVTAKRIYAHLMDTYGVVKESDKEKNRAKLSEPWTPDQPIEALWKRIKDWSHCV